MTETPVRMERDPRILIVDDTRFDRELVSDALAGLGQIECCASAEDALAANRAAPADVVVSDITMPGLSGVELLQRVRGEFPRTDFVLLTGDASVESAIAALRHGAADYLVKPVRPEQLRRVVEQILQVRLLADENRRLRATLHTIEEARALAPCLEPGKVYPLALDLLLATLSRSRGVAVFHRTPIPRSDAIAFRGLTDGEAQRVRTVLIDDKFVDLDAYAAVEVIARGPVHAALAEAGLPDQALLSVPVRGQESEHGVIWIFEDGRPFNAEEIERARIVARHAVASLHNAERYHHAKERAFIDDVTEVYNARYLHSAAENEIQRAERYGSALSVLFLDLDRFKTVNDRYGHLVGSDVLRRLSQLLTECVRQVDTLARYGGDEFTILLVDTAHNEALAVAERIRRSISEHVFEAGRDTTLRLSISIGVASYPDHGDGREALLDAADKAMYRAKSQGRNRVCSAGELDG